MIRPQEVFQSLFQAAALEGEEPLSADAPVFTVWTIPADLPYFKGHFPQTPILPAIAIVDASTYYLQRALGRPELKLKAVTLAKFLSPILPEQTVRIGVERFAENVWQVEWKLEGTDQLLATLRLAVVSSRVES